MLEFERDSRSGRPFGEKEKTADERIVDELEDEESARRDTAAAEVGDSSTREVSDEYLACFVKREDGSVYFRSLQSN